jgi:hypothetical protein
MRASLWRVRPCGLHSHWFSTGAAKADELHAVALYGAHSTGADIDHLEAGLLEDFAARMALAYEKYFKKSIQEELRTLREQLA